MGNFKLRNKEMEKTIEKVFNRQFERMKNELLNINMPQGYLTIISKYWDFMKMDIQDMLEEEEEDAI